MLTGRAPPPARLSAKISHSSDDFIVPPVSTLHPNPPPLVPDNQHPSTVRAGVMSLGSAADAIISLPPHAPHCPPPHVTGVTTEAQRYNGPLIKARHGVSFSRRFRPHRHCRCSASPSQIIHPPLSLRALPCCHYQLLQHVCIIL